MPNGNLNIKLLNNFIIYIAVSFIILIIVVYVLYANTRIKIRSIGVMKYPRVCHSVAVKDENNIVILGGYNNSDYNHTPFSTELFNLHTQKSEELFTSNFLNKYGNHIFVNNFFNRKYKKSAKTKNSQNILVNIQPVKLNDNKTGIEVFDFNTQKLTKIEANLKARNAQNIPVYYNNIDSFDGILGTYIIGEQNDKLEKNISKFEYFDINKRIVKTIPSSDRYNFGLFENLKIGGISTINYNKLNDAVTLDDLKKIVQFNHTILFPEIYELTFSLYHDDSNEYVVVDKNNRNFPIQIFRINIYQKIQQAIDVEIPRKLKNYDIDTVIQLDDFCLLFIFRNGKELYFAKYITGSEKLKYIGKVKSDKIHQKFAFIKQQDTLVKFPIKIYAIGGLTGTQSEKFRCGESITTGIIVSDEIDEIYIK